MAERQGLKAGRAIGRRIGPLLSAAALLAGCTVGPNFRAPSFWSPASWFASRPKPAQTLPSVTVAAPLNPNWWEAFHDPILTSLEDRIASDNLDVRTATVRLAESRAQRSIVSADEFPQVNGNASYTREKASARGLLGLASGSAGSAASGASQGTVANGSGFGAGGIPGQSAGLQPFNLWQYGFDASWELDLWGRVRREIESAGASVEASAEARRDTLLSVMAELARDYIELRGLQRNLQITQENLKTQESSLQLTRARYAGGLTSDLDVANAAAQVASTAALIPNLQQRIEQEINRLSFLLAEPPGALRGMLEEARPVPPVPPVVPIGLPSELARRRPDIREAEAKLHAATADIGVATADFYPQVTLSGSLGIQSLQFKDLANWGARQYALGPGITLPIFQGGRLRGTLELRKEQQKEAALDYQQTVLQAFHDVDNALIAYRAEQRRREELATAVQQNRRAVALAQSRYQQGITDFLEVLDAQRSLLAAEEEYSNSTTTVSTNLVQLYKALGGGWESAYPLPGSTLNAEEHAPTGHRAAPAAPGTI
ncbi:MAG TPA: efflux transporter outer membrane subunit [Acetobacteraceae bacterium]|nr:efflux transporter outer membrane subunit [Acetobacteraceae bacterium]